MKKSIVVYLLAGLLFGMSACGNSSSDNASNESQAKRENASVTDESSQSNETSEIAGENGSENSSKDMKANVNEEDKNTLSQYSNEQIEYARVWLMLGENRHIDELNVTRIPAGTPINPNDETSAVYPVDVIQLAGGRLVDGSVTYSGNGDGTTKVYQVPLRWESNVPEELDEDFMKNYTEGIIEDAELVYVDPGNNEEIIELIEVLKVHN